MTNESVPPAETENPKTPESPFQAATSSANSAPPPTQASAPPTGAPPLRTYSDKPLDETTVPDLENLCIFTDQKYDRDRLIAQSFLFAQFIRLNAKRIIRKEPRRILDLGCGDGHLSLVFNRLYPKAQIVGIDKDPRAIATADRLQQTAAGISGKIHYQAMDAEQNLPDEPFDLIYISMMLLQTQNPQKVIELAYERLSPGGYIWIKELLPDFAAAVDHPNWERLAGLVVSTMTKTGFHPTLSTKLEAILTEIGFTDVKTVPETFNLNDGTATGRIMVSVGLAVFFNAFRFISMIDKIPESELMRLHNELSKDALKLKGKLNFPNVFGRKPQVEMPTST